MKLAQRDYFGKALVDLAAQNPDVVVLDADLAGSTRTKKFQEVAPKRFFEMGIAEADMIGVASGLASAGKIPFASTFGVFATGRCWDQIRVSVAYPHMNVKIVATHCGITVGEDGATHQALEDIAIMRVLPNMTVIVPSDAYETYAAVMAAAEFEGPVYIRLARSSVPVVNGENVKFSIGKAQVLREGTDISMIACGQMVAGCLKAADILEKDGISAEVLNMSTIKPMDYKALYDSVLKTGAVLTAEEHSVVGGLGSAVAEFLCEVLPTPLSRIGIHDTFGESGAPAELMEKYGLGVSDIVAEARKTIEMKVNQK